MNLLQNDNLISFCDPKVVILAKVGTGALVQVFTHPSKSKRDYWSDTKLVLKYDEVSGVVSVGG